LFDNHRQNKVLPMQLRYVPDLERYARLTTDELRAGYLVQNLFRPGAAELLYTDADRAVIGGIVPTAQPLALTTAKELAADFFAERRELGVINLAGAGRVKVDGQTFELS
jgi:4-deoxy-L-threo-5-hexosulose-uronate ketol-isomerase